MTKNVELISQVLKQMSAGVFGQTPAAIVQLQDGGVLITSPDGDHVLVLVQSVHFEPGIALPF